MDACLPPDHHPDDAVVPVWEDQITSFSHWVRDERHAERIALSIRPKMPTMPASAVIEALRWLFQNWPLRRIIDFVRIVWDALDKSETREHDRRMTIVMGVMRGWAVALQVRLLQEFDHSWEAEIYRHHLQSSEDIRVIPPGVVTKTPDESAKFWRQTWQ